MIDVLRALDAARRALGALRFRCHVCADPLRYDARGVLLDEHGRCETCEAEYRRWNSERIARQLAAIPHREPRPPITDEEHAAQIAELRRRMGL